MLKVENWPKIHQINLNFFLNADDATRTKAGTIVPLITADEAMIASSFYTNPRNTNFAPSDESHCCPQSNVNRISGSVQLSLAKFAIETDKVKQMRVTVIPIAVAFEDLESIDEKTTTTIKAILELQSEATDRQTYPIYNGTDLIGDTTNLGADQLGLTTNEIIEGVTFDQQQLYDALSFYTNSGKLSSCIGKIRHYVVRDKSKTFKFNITLPKKAKRMNPYTFFGLLIYVPQLGTENQFGYSTDTTDIPHIQVVLRAQYNEWNPNFLMESNLA